MQATGEEERSNKRINGRSWLINEKQFVRGAPSQLFQAFSLEFCLRWRRGRLERGSWRRRFGVQENLRRGEERIRFGAVRKEPGTSGRRERRRTELQTEKKGDRNREQKRRSSTSGRAMGEEAEMRLDAEAQHRHGNGPVGFWNPPVASPLSATHSRHFLRGSPARGGPVGKGRLQGPGRALAVAGTLRSTRAAAEPWVPLPAQAAHSHMWHSDSGGLPSQYKSYCSGQNLRSLV